MYIRSQITNGYTIFHLKVFRQILENLAVLRFIPNVRFDILAVGDNGDGVIILEQLPQMVFLIGHAG